MVLASGWQSLDLVSNLLRRQGRTDLARLLVHSKVCFEWYQEVSTLDGTLDVSLVVSVVHAPFDNYYKLSALSQKDTNEILEAMQTIWPYNETDREAITRITFQLDAESLNEEPLTLFREPFGWSHVDNTLDDIRTKLTIASDGNDYAEVGLLCRRVLVELGRTIFDPEKHPPLNPDDANVSPDDIKRISDRYLSVEMEGPSQRTARQCVRSAVQLASELVHNNNLNYRDAMLCAQATFNAIGLVAVISGNREATETYEILPN